MKIIPRKGDFAIDYSKGIGYSIVIKDTTGD